MLTFTYCLAPIAKGLRAGLFQVNTPVSPSEINAVCGGNYASKYVSLMRNHYGFTIEETRAGRTVVAYTVLNAPANVQELSEFEGGRVANPAKAKAPKQPKVVVTKTKAVKKAAASFMAKRKADAVTKQFGTSGEVSSYGVDADWDSMEGINVRDLVV
jgi:hypothetical protein